MQWFLCLFLSRLCVIVYKQTHFRKWEVLQKTSTLNLTSLNGCLKDFQATAPHSITRFSPTFQETTKVKFPCIVLTFSTVINKRKANLSLVRRHIHNSSPKHSTYNVYAILYWHTSHGTKSTQTISFHTSDILKFRARTCGKVNVRSLCYSTISEDTFL